MKTAAWTGLVLGSLLAGCGDGGGERPAPEGAADGGAREAVVTPSLLEAWLAEPGAAPGRTVSSPWPERIEVRSARRLAADRWEVAGEVVLMTSVEVARGGDAGRERVDLEVSRTAGGWRISGWSD